MRIALIYPYFGISKNRLSHPNICSLVKLTLLFQVLDESVDTLHLTGNVYPLRTVLCTFVTTDAMVGLSQFGHRAVVTDKECASCLAVGGVLRS